MSVAGYHHHVAVNAWNRKRHPAAPEAGGIGLLWYEIRLPQSADPTALATALPAARSADGTLLARDPTASRSTSPAPDGCESVGGAPKQPGRGPPP